MSTSKASQGTKQALPALGVSFFAVRNLQPFVLPPAQMNPSTPPEDWAELGLQDNLSHLNYPAASRK